MQATTYKIKLIKKIKEYPCVWMKEDVLNNNSEDKLARRDAWDKITTELYDQNSVFLVVTEIQKMWNSLFEVYFRTIFIKTIERNFEAPEWPYFHQMTFLYEPVKEKIQYMLGGISPPLFKPKPNSLPMKTQCPCCIPVLPDQNSPLDLNSIEVTEECEDHEDQEIQEDQNTVDSAGFEMGPEEYLEEYIEVEEEEEIIVKEKNLEEYVQVEEEEIILKGKPNPIITRSQIIEAVKANPAAYTDCYNDPAQRKNYLNAWKKISEQFGNAPLRSLKNRWKSIKSSFLNELVCELYYGKKQRSNWEFFDQLDFLRPCMKEAVEEIRATRDKMNKKLDEIRIQNEISSIQSTQNEKTLLLDKEARSLLKNRPFKVTAISTPVDQPPAKKMRVTPITSVTITPLVSPLQSVTLSQNDYKSKDNSPMLLHSPNLKTIGQAQSQVVSNEKSLGTNNKQLIRGFISIVPSSSITEPSASQENPPMQNKSNAVLPTLDLTLDDDPVEEPLSTSISNNVTDFEMSHVSNADYLYETENEPKDGDDERDNEVNDQVICLDEDSVSSYEEVVFIMSEENS